MARSKKQQNLSIAGIKKEDAKRFKQNKLEFENGTVLVDKDIRQTKAEEMVKEIIDLIKIEKLKEENEEESSLDLLNKYYGELLATLIVKYFTNIEFEEESNIESLLLSYKFLKDNEYYYHIIEELGSDNIEKLVTKVNEKLKELNIVMEQIQKEKEIGEVSGGI